MSFFSLPDIPDINAPISPDYRPDLPLNGAFTLTPALLIAKPKVKNMPTNAKFYLYEKAVSENRGKTASNRKII
jgi:hypothetical protein